MSELLLPTHQASVLLLLLEREIELEVRAIAEILDEPYPQISGAVQSLAEQGYVTLREETITEIIPGPKAKQLEDGVLPERRVMHALAENNGRIELKDLARLSGLPQKEAGRAIKPLEAMGYAQRDGGSFVASDALDLENLPPMEHHEKLLQYISRHGSLTREEAMDEDIDLDKAREGIGQRGGLITERERRRWWASISDQGRHVDSASVHSRRTVNILDHELLKEGAWRSVEFRPYDVTLASKNLIPGKMHPFRRVLENTRRAFFDMGFTEVSSPHVESAFWTFDALFQPQDHPAREMQDTFYVKRPNRASLPTTDFVEYVRQTHENGWETGSDGWGTDWSAEKASEVVLRTHTTAASIRALAEDPNPPRKIFIVGTVFRRETIDYKHLPLFHQVDGIIIDEHGSFSSLLGTLAEFYRKMGFEKFEFRPGFFPYTEPSVEVFVWHDERKDWVEMGGAGVFRDEVTRPFGCTVPVLAWGLGLERLAMFKYGLASIRDLYHSDIDWLREVPLCR